VRAVAAFVFAGFAVTLTAGLILVAGPGAALHRWIDGIPTHVVHVAQIAGGAVALAVGVGMLIGAARTRDRPAAGRRIADRSPVALGAGLAVAELPTAFPYLTTMAAVIAATSAPGPRVLMVVVYNLCYVVPLLGVIVIRAFAAQRAQVPLAAVRRLAERWGVAAIGVTTSGFGGVFLARGLLG
jgi:cytochrome c biogenesis protein CcdA